LAWGGDKFLLPKMGGGGVGPRVTPEDDEGISKLWGWEALRLDSGNKSRNDKVGLGG
jgi:hypothetical protein